ncbi:IS66-like element accessory protein TnpA [Methylomonas sp. MV1]|uniref:IS66-like element accessory protein TnpA n=1 Tax=Methylomonas sp. MV1 TaxID=3073620 RepID=UPI0028A33F2E|nr:transposase [Methylomonas sp. MV1]MDT4332967.1 transposase [Methylomonas sp. MV1]
MENKSRLSRALVVGHRSNGCCRYDPEAKRELVEACLQPGVSVARMALEHGINANLLRKWINQYREISSSMSPSIPATLSAFAPVLSMAVPKPVQATLHVALPNGVKLELQGVDLTELSPLLNGLAALPCSVSNRD